jgi:hypothetical protein
MSTLRFFLPAILAEGKTRLIVGGSLLANTGCQSASMSLTNRVHEQAPSHKYRVDLGTGLIVPRSAVLFL